MCINEKTLWHGQRLNLTDLDHLFALEIFHMIHVFVIDNNAILSANIGK